jgi:hypothetical protein
MIGTKDNDSSTDILQVFGLSTATKKQPTVGFKQRQNLDARIPAEKTLEIDYATENAMQKVLYELLRDKGGSCSLMEAASALSGSNKVRDAYAGHATRALRRSRRQQESNGEPGFVQSLTNSFLSWFTTTGTTSIQQQQQQQQQRTRGSRWKQSRKAEDQAMVCKYEFMHALRFFETRLHASSERVESWQQAREIFSSRFEFLEEDDSLLISDFAQKLQFADTQRQEQQEARQRKHEEERRRAEEQRLAIEAEQTAREAEEQRLDEEEARLAAEAEEQERIRLEQERAEEARQGCLCALCQCL